MSHKGNATSTSKSFSRLVVMLTKIWTSFRIFSGSESVFSGDSLCSTVEHASANVSRRELTGPEGPDPGPVGSGPEGFGLVP